MENISKQLDKMKKSFDAVALSAGKAEKAISNFNRSSKDIKFPSKGFDFPQIDAFTNVLSRAGKAIANAAGIGFSFGQSMANLSAITGITGDELGRLEENARRVGTESGMGVQAAAQAYSTLASQVNVSRVGIEGLNNLQAKSVTLAQATGSSLDEAANTLAGTINRFGLSAEEADRVINVLAAGSKFGAAGVGELSQSFDALGTTASAMGMSIESTAGALEVLSQANLKGSEAGTALRQIMQSLNTELGIDLSETSLSTALQALQPQLENTSLLNQVFGDGNLATAQYLIQNAEAVAQMTEALTGSDVAQEQAAIRTETNAMKLAELRAGIDNVKVGIADSLGGLAVYGSLFAENAAAIGGFFSISKACLPMLASMGSTIKTLAGSISLQTVAAKAASVATKVWSGIQLVFNAILTANPLGMIIVAIGSLVAAVVACYNHFEGFRNLCDKVWEALKSLGKGIADVWGKMKAFFGMKDSAAPIIQTDNSFETQTRKDTEALNKKREAALNLEQVLQKEGNAVETASGMPLQPVPPPKGSMAFSLAIDDKSRLKIEQELDSLAQEKRTIELNLKYSKPMEDTRQKEDMANMTTQFAKDSVMPKMDKIEVPEYINSYAEAMDAAKQKQQEMQEDMGAMSNAFGSLGEAIGGAAGQWLQYGENLISAISQAIPALLTMLGITAQETAATQTETSANVANACSKAMKAHAGIPFVGIAMGVAAVAAIIAAMSSIPKFADGGLAYGPALGLFGEYAGAGNNPEVIAPLNKLKSLIGPAATGVGGEVVFRIEGRTLKGVLERENRLQQRS